jgi:hypothetical protein
MVTLVSVQSNLDVCNLGFYFSFFFFIFFPKEIIENIFKCFPSNSVRKIVFLFFYVLKKRRYHCILKRGHAWFSLLQKKQTLARPLKLTSNGKYNTMVMLYNLYILYNIDQERYFVKI